MRTDHTILDFDSFLSSFYRLLSLLLAHNSVLCALTWSPMTAAARSKLCSSVSAWLGVLASSAMSSV